MEAEDDGQNMNGMFYQDERLDQLMEDNEDDDMILNEHQNELLMQQEMEDDIAVM